MTNRKLGANMKPRGPVEATEVTSEETPAEESASVGQISSAMEPFLEPENQILPEQPDTTLEPETAGFGEAPPVAEINEAAVTEEVPGDHLADLMRKSTELAEDPDFLKPAKPDPAIAEFVAGGLVIPTAEEIEAIASTGSIPPLLKLDPSTGEVALVPEGLGEQPNGTFKIVVTMEEGYIGGIKQAAEAENETVEEWTSRRFHEWMESWWAPPRMA